jgi:hypothetical protein
MLPTQQATTAWGQFEALTNLRKEHFASSAVEEQ